MSAFLTELIQDLKQSVSFSTCCTERATQKEKVFWESETDGRMYILLNICGHITKTSGVPNPIDTSRVANEAYVDFLDSLYAKKKTLFLNLETSDTFKGHFRLEYCFDDGRCLLMSLPLYPIRLYDLFFGCGSAGNLASDILHQKQVAAFSAMKEQLPAMITTLTLTDEMIHTDFSLSNLCIDADNRVRFIDVDSIESIFHRDHFLYYDWPWYGPIEDMLVGSPYSTKLYPMAKEVDDAIALAIESITASLSKSSFEQFAVGAGHDSKDQHS